MYIPRIYDDLESYLEPNKALLLYGPRRVGKTTLLRAMLENTSLTYRLETGDDLRARTILGSDDLTALKEYAHGYDLIAIDEAQRIPRIGWGIKLLVDNIPNIKIIATGSSSFELAGQVGEPLTGRKRTLTLYPLSQHELSTHINTYDLKQKLHEYLIFGSYPEILSTSTHQEKSRKLEELVDSYVLKDIFELEQISNPKLLLDLLRMIAFQIGSQVSHAELATQLGIDRKTVARYLSLLERSFVLYNVRGYSKNLRKEITKMGKYYFFDNGVRNAVIANFNDTPLRDDMGPLWENFLMMERLKKRTYMPEHYANAYFWRTWDKQEVDLVEEHQGALCGYEFKWGKSKVKEPKQWQETYPEADYTIVNKENYTDFIL